MIYLTPASRHGMLKDVGLTTQLSGGLLYLFAGPVPPNAAVALDMTEQHTLVGVVSNDGLGTGLAFDDPANGILSKAAAASWGGTAAFDGAEDSEPSLLATFYRLCAAADDGQGAADPSTGYRVQGTVGVALSKADLKLDTATYEPSDTITVGRFMLALSGG